MLNVVAASTVAAAVPMLPPLATSLIDCAVNNELPAFVKVFPDTTERFPLKVAAAFTVRVSVPGVSPSVVLPFTCSVPPIDALFVTLKAVPDPVRLTDP